MTVRRRAELGKTRIYTQKGDKLKESGIAKMTEAFINVVYSIYDCVKEENSNFNNVKVQTKMIKYVKSYGKKNVKNCMF